MTSDGLDPVLAGEHAAVFAYGSAGAVLVRLAATGASRRRRTQRIRRAPRKPRRAVGSHRRRWRKPAGRPPAYAVPFPLSSPAAVVNFLAGVEDRLAATAASVVGSTRGADRLRAAGVLAAAAVRAVELRRLAGATPSRAVTPLPGLPGR